MNQITPPPAAHNSDRFILCQEAMEAAFQDVAAAAIAAGWERGEVATALVEFADNNALSFLANQDLGVVLAALDRQ